MSEYGGKDQRDDGLSIHGKYSKGGKHGAKAIPTATRLSNKWTQSQCNWSCGDYRKTPERPTICAGQGALRYSDVT